jgi:hypothetical protein
MKKEETAPAGSSQEGFTGLTEPSPAVMQPLIDLASKPMGKGGESDVKSKKPKPKAKAQKPKPPVKKKPGANIVVGHTAAGKTEALLRPVIAALKAKRKKRKAGRKKERTQISVRIDRAVMDLAYQEIKRTGVHISDLLERGLLLSLRENQVAPAPFATARILLYDRGVDFARRCASMAALEAFEQARPLTLTERFFRDLHLDTIDAVREWEGYAEVEMMLAEEHAEDISRRT